MPNRSPPKDTIVLENGDPVTGVLDREVSGIVYFKSDELGELTIQWTKIKTLRTRNGYVVLENTPGVRVHHFQAEAEHGTLAVANGKVQVTPQPSREVASQARSQSRRPCLSRTRSSFSMKRLSCAR